MSRLSMKRARKKVEEPKPIYITDPLVIIYPEDDRNIFRIHVPDGYDHAQYGLLVCDLVRHIAKALKVHEDAVWMWVDAERDMPTAECIEHS
jgi:hypothetical protein